MCRRFCICWLSESFGHLESELMNARQAKWIVEKLCPFILREQGRGFGMSGWRGDFPQGFTVRLDGVEREVPSCGTICCIGGSIEVLRQLDESSSAEQVGDTIGLSGDQTDTLFYGWYRKWPEPFRSRFAAAKTPLAKARVAVSLLKRVAKTRGECLNTRIEE